MWSETVEGEYEIQLTSEQTINKYWTENKTLIFIIGGIILVIIIIIIFLIFSRHMSRVR